MSTEQFTEAELMALESMVQYELRVNENQDNNFYAWCLLDQINQKVGAMLKEVSRPPVVDLAKGASPRA